MFPPPTTNRKNKFNATIFNYAKIDLISQREKKPLQPTRQNFNSGSTPYPISIALTFRPKLYNKLSLYIPMRGYIRTTLRSWTSGGNLA